MEQIIITSNAGDTVHEVNYEWMDYVSNYDPSGIDTISGANSTSGLLITLNQSSVNGSYLSYSLNADETEPPYSRADGFVGIIENATGSDYDDFIYDGVINSIGSVINARNGDDYITHSGGNDIVDGGNGSDTLAMNFSFSDIQSINKTDDSYYFQFSEHQLEFKNIETIVDSNLSSRTIDELFTPSITSSDITSIEENVSTDTVIYNIDAFDPDNDPLIHSISGTDASYFRIDSNDGEIRLINSADYESKSSYIFDATVSDGSLSDTKTVTVNVIDVNEAPTLTSSDTSTVEENASTDTYL